jgi:DNA gyrase subunit A
MLSWIGIDQSMQMRETSRDADKKLHVNNYLNLHPHGDNAAYEAAVFMAQAWKKNNPLLEISGNGGSITGDVWASSRYTEVLLTPIGASCFDDLSKKTVKWINNYDNTRLTPEVLPVKFPQLIVNGQNGIAVGLTSDIPTFNLGEVIDATIYTMNNFDTVTTDDIVKIMPGPDFPTGGVVTNAGQVAKIYETGNGGFINQAAYTIVKNKIHINNIPYLTDIKSIVSKIVENIKSGVLQGITAIDDFTDKSTKSNCVDIVITFASTIDPQTLLRQLFEVTGLQNTIKYNFNVLDGEEVIYRMKMVTYLKRFIDFRRDVVYRKHYEKCIDYAIKLDILQGYAKVLPFIDEVISIIKSSADERIAKNNLIKRFELHEKQAVRIVETKLGRLTSMGIQSVNDEISKLSKLIKDLQAFIVSPKNIDEYIVNELTEIKNKYATPRKTKLINTGSSGSVTETKREQRLAPVYQNDTCFITLSNSGLVRRIPESVYSSQGRGGKGRKLKIKEDDPIINSFFASNNDVIWCLTESGKVIEMVVGCIKECTTDVYGVHISNYIKIPDGDRIQSITKYDKTKSHFVIITKNSLGKKVPLTEFKNIFETGIIATRVRDGDAIVSAKFANDDDCVIVTTRNNLCSQIIVEDFPDSLRPAYGNTILKLKEGDTVFSMELTSIAGEEIPDNIGILTVATDGQGKITKLADYPVYKRPCVGYLTMQLNKGQKVAFTSVVDTNKDQDIILITKKGKSIRMKVADIPVTMNRQTSGVRLIEMRDPETKKQIDYIIGGAQVEITVDE